MKNVTLTTAEERIRIPSIISKKNAFKRIVKTSLANYKTIFSNCIIISGVPGSGKTTSLVSSLESLMNEGVIAEYKRCSGHITPRSLYVALKETANAVNGSPRVLVLDDTDMMAIDGNMELIKSACDTKSNLPGNRNVYYMTEDSRGFRYDGFVFIVTNNLYNNPSKINIHEQAILDRGNLVSIDLQKDDMYVYTTYLVEKYLNDNEDNLTDEEIDSIVNLFNTDFRRWMKTDAFKESGINYSTRLVKKFVDSQRMFGEDWKTFSTFYNKLNSYADLVESRNSLVTGEELPEEKPVVKKAPKKSNPKVNVIKKSSTAGRRFIVKTTNGKETKFYEPAKNSKGEYIKKDGTPYEENFQRYYSKLNWIAA